MINKIKLRYRLLVFYILAILLVFPMSLTSLGKCNGGGFFICFPFTFVYVIFLGLPGYTIMKFLGIFIPHLKSWISFSENLTHVTCVNFFFTALVLFLIGILLEKRKTIAVFVVVLAIIGLWLYPIP